MADGEWLDAETVARRLGLSVTGVYRLAGRGDLPASRPPVRVQQAELDAYLERSRIRPGQLTHLNPRRRIAPTGFLASDP